MREFFATVYTLCERWFARSPNVLRRSSQRSRQVGGRRRSRAEHTKRAGIKQAKRIQKGAGRGTPPVAGDEFDIRAARTHTKIVNETQATLRAKAIRTAL